MCEAERLIWNTPPPPPHVVETQAALSLLLPWLCSVLLFLKLGKEGTRFLFGPGCDVVKGTMAGLSDCTFRGSRSRKDLQARFCGSQMDV